MHWQWPDPEAGWQSDRGLAYADGVFETMGVLPSGPVLAAAHRARLLAGCEALGLPFTSEHWEQWLQQLGNRNWLVAKDKPGHVIKVIVTRGSGGRGYSPPPLAEPRVVTSWAPMPQIPRDPVAVHLCRTPVTASPEWAGFKTLNRLDQVLAAREIPPGYFEGLMSDVQGRLTEGTRSNLFVLSGNVLYTPPRRHLAVAGTFRDVLMESLPQMGIQVRERPITFAQLRQAESIFIANSIMGVVAVARIGCFRLGYSERVAAIQSFTRQRFGI